MEKYIGNGSGDEHLELRSSTYEELGNTGRARIKITTGYGYYSEPEIVHDAAFNNGLELVPESILKTEQNSKIENP